MGGSSVGGAFVHLFEEGPTRHAHARATSSDSICSRSL